MATGPHYHNFKEVIKTVIDEVDLSGFGIDSIREKATIYSLCVCGCVNKTETIVTHLDGKSWQS